MHKGCFHKGEVVNDKAPKLCGGSILSKSHVGVIPKKCLLDFNLISAYFPAISWSFSMKPHPAIELCPVLAQALQAAPSVQKIFAAMPPSHQREYNRHVAEAKKPETQTVRAAKALAMIAAWGRKKAK